jgi:hypothetical protein
MNGGSAVLERWFARHPVEAWAEVEQALFAIANGTWADRYYHLDEVTVPGGVIMFIRPDLVLVWREITEYPDYFRPLYLGHPDDTTFE